MKAVLAGCGNAARAWFDRLGEFSEIKIVGLVDTDEEAARLMREEQRLPADTPVGTDLRRIITESSADTVFDCTIPPAHHSIVTTAFECGCDVLGEKPLAESLEQAGEMVRMAREKGRVYSIIQNRRYLDSIRQVQSVLDQQRIGEPHTFNADFYLGCHFGGFRDQMDHVLLLDMAIHSFDQARFLCPSRPVKVFCHEYNPPGSWYAHGASAVAIFTMEDQSVFNYRGSWCAEGLNTSWQCGWRIVGDGGSLVWDGEDSITIETPDEEEGFQRQQKREEVPVTPGLEFTERGGVIADFCRAVREKKPAPTAAEDNILSLAMVLGAVKSAEEDRAVRIEYDNDGLPVLV